MSSQSATNRTFLIILLGVLAALGPFTIDMYLPGFVSIAKDLNTDERHVAFTLTSYFVGIGIGQLIYGPIIDKYGRKRPLIFGLLIYIAASVFCALSPNIESMMLYRFIQALGGCVGMVATNAIISDVYAKEERAKAFSSLILVMGVAPLIAPSIGSLLLQQANWHFIFYFLAIFSGCVTLLIIFFLPETAPYTHNNKLKIAQITKEYWTILKDTTFLRYTLVSSLSMSVLFAYISSSSFIFQTLYLLDQQTFSLLFAINATGLIAGSSLNGQMTKRIHYLKIANIAAVLLLMVAGIAFSAVYFGGMIPVYWMVAFVFLHLLLIGFINPNATAASLEPFTYNAGAASALGGAMRMGLGALTAAMIGIFQSHSAITLFITTLLLSFTIILLILNKNRKTVLA